MPQSPFMQQVFGGRLKGRAVTSYKTPPKLQTPEATKQAVAESLSGLVEGYNQAFGQARRANEQRYQQMLRIADQDYARSAGVREQMRGVAEQTTGQRAADIRSGAYEEEANVMQRLRQLGMSGTTVAPTLKGGIKTRMEESLNRLADTMQQTKLGIMREQAGATRGTRLGIMERRTDEYPNQAMLAGLVSGIGTGQRGDLIPSTLGALGGLYGGGGNVATASQAGSARTRAAHSSLTPTQYTAKYGPARR